MNARIMPPDTMQTTISQSYQSAVLGKLSEFEALETEWDALLTKTGENHLNMAHGWLLAWLNHFPPRQLLVIIVRNTVGNLVAAAPFKISTANRGLFRRRLRHLQFIGTEPSVYDWIKLIVAPGENTGQIYAEIARQLLQTRQRWDVLDLQFCPDLEQQETLRNFLTPWTFSQELTPTMSVPFIPLEGNEAEYLKTGRKKGLTKNLKNSQNHLDKDFPEQPLKLEFLEPSEQSESAMDVFFQRHIDYWAGRGVRSDFTRFPKLTSFYKIIHRVYSGHENVPARALFSVLQLGDRPLSYHLGFRQENGYLAHMCNYDQDYKKYRPGFFHMDDLIRHALNMGGTRFEFGRGDESYKEQWVLSKMPLWNLVIYNSRLSYLRCKADDGIKKLLKK